MNRESVGAHGGKTFGEFLLHGIDGRIDPYQGHDPKSNDSNGDAGTEFIAPDRTEGKGKNIAHSHE